MLHLAGNAALVQNANIVPGHIAEIHLSTMLSHTGDGVDNATIGVHQPLQDPALG